jgi:tetratricopeptide (TPR) repeat protein/photosystem II stability/assembly factor-like uncharacterized protein
MTERYNPYIAGAPVIEENMFFGREGVFKWIKNSLTGKYVDHILVLHGQRRVGKTSVLKHIPNRLPNKYIPIFIDLQGRVSTTLGRFLGWLAREITRALQKEGIELPRVDRKAFEADPDYFESTFLPTVEQHLKNRTLLLTFDEFDTFESTDAQEGLAIPFMAILKRLMDHNNLSFIFSIGSSGRKLENMQAAYTNFFKQALYRKISFLDQDDAHDLITKPVEGIVTYTAEAIQRIIEVTSAHPYFIQLVCHELFSRCQKEDRWEVNLVDVNNILEPVVERGTVNLKFVWDEASDLEKWVLASLAANEINMSLRELETCLKREQVRFSRHELERALLHLREKDVLRENNQFIIHLLRMWLKRNRPIAMVREELQEVNPIVSRLLEIGQEYHDKQEYNRAIQNFKEALTVEEDNLEARFLLGSSELARGDYGKAIAEFETVLETHPEDVMAQRGFCDAYLAMGDDNKAEGKFQEAEYAYQQVLGVNPQHQEAQQRMSYIHYRKAVNAITGSQELALEELEKALEYAEEAVLKDTLAKLQSFIRGECDLGELLLLWGEKAREMKLWDEAGDLLDAYQRESGDGLSVAEAIAEIRIQINNNRKDTIRSRAARLTRLERYDEAIEAWNSYVRFAPEESPDVRQKIAALQDKLKAGEEKRSGLSPVLRSALIGIVIILSGLVIYLLTRPEPAAPVPPTPTITVSPTASITPSPTATIRPTFTPTLEPTAIPLAWSRINSGLFLPRDEVNVIVIHPDDPDVLFAGTAQSGVYKTINGGLSWEPAQTGLGGGDVQTLIINPDDPDVLYASILHGGVYKSTNGGQSWVEANNGIDLGHFWQFTSYLTMDPNDPDHLVFSSGSAYYESWDGAQNWELPANENNCFVYEMDFNLDSSAIFQYVSGPNFCDGGFGVYKAEIGTDLGIPVLTNNNESFNTHNVAVNPHSGAIYNVHEQNQTLFTSLDDGKTWGRKKLNRCARVFAFENGMAACTSWDKSLYTSPDDWSSYKKSNLPIDNPNIFVLSPLSPDTLYVGGSSIYKSTDGGATWQEAANGIGSGPNQIVYSPNEGAIYIEQKANQYLCSHQEPSSLYRYDLNQSAGELIDQKGCYTFLSQDGESIFRFSKDRTNQLLLSKDGGRTYAPTGIRGVNERAWIDLGQMIYQEEEVLYAWKDQGEIEGGSNTALYYSYDQGETWEVVREGPADRYIGGMLYTNPLGGDYIWNPNTGLNISEDGGKTWQGCPDHVPTWGQISNTLIAAFPDDDDWIYEASVGKGLLQISCLKGSAYPVKAIDSPIVNSVVIDPHDPQRIYVGSNGGFFISLDGGESWTTLNDGLLGALTIYSISIDPFAPGTIYISTPYGIFQLEDTN